ncbi:MAG: hypothetical protein H7146_02625 [Burkholderiaceae bacterium]|nr:hypothetical protein [Microbacteriaceae bacterium]
MLSREPIPRRFVEIGFIALRIGGFVAAVFRLLDPGKAAVFLGIQLGLFGLSRNIRGNLAMTSAWVASTTRSSTSSSPRCRARGCAGRRRSLRPTAARSPCRTQTGLAEYSGIVLRYISSEGLGQKDPFVCPLVASLLSS